MFSAASGYDRAAQSQRKSPTGGEMTSRKHPSAAFWATVVLVVALIGYPLSFGPWCWATSRLSAMPKPVPAIYRPFTYILESDYSDAFSRVIRWYTNLGAVNEFWCLEVLGDEVDWVFGEESHL
jgi:hypothetical protein